jgi:hypothetical protein
VGETIKSVLEWQVGKISGLLDNEDDVPVERLRDEAAELQAMIAEAARLERIAQADDRPAPAK